MVFKGQPPAMMIEKQIMEEPTNKLNENIRKQTEITRGLTESARRGAKRSEAMANKRE